MSISSLNGVNVNRAHRTYGDRYVPMGVYSENWESSTLQATKKSNVSNLNTAVAKVLYPNAETKIFAHHTNPTPKPYCAKVVRKFETSIFRVFDAPGITTEFFDSALATTTVSKKLFAVHLFRENQQQILQMESYDYSTCKQLVLKDQNTPVSHIQYAKDGLKLFGCQMDKVFILDLTSGSETQFKVKDSVAMDISEEGLAAVGTELSKVVLYDARQSKRIRNLSVLNHQDGRVAVKECVTKCAFSSNGQFIAAGSGEGTFALYDRRNDLNPLYFYKDTCGLKAVAFGFDGHVFFGGDEIRCLNLVSAKLQLKDLLTLDMGAQISTIKTVRTASATDLWVAKDSGIECVRYQNHAFQPIGKVKDAEGQVIPSMEIMDDKLIASFNEKEMIKFYESSQLRKVKAPDSKGLKSSQNTIR